MNKKFKLYFIVGLSGIMVALWFAIYITGTQGQQINYWWQLFMGLTALTYGIFGIFTAKKWNWLKSGVGRGVFFLSLGLIMWGIGQLGWTYFLFVEPDVEAPQSHLLDFIDISAIPLWFAGIVTLSKATGAKYGLKKLSGKLLVVLVSLIMILLSWYFLVEVARGGAAYFDQSFGKQFFDLGYSIGDAILLTTAIVIFALSWKLLGGRFRLPIITILVSFAFLYLADFWFSYRDGQGVYFNGDPVDLLFFLMITTMGLGITMLDPNRVRSKAAPAKVSTVAETPTPVESNIEAQSQPENTQEEATTTESSTDTVSVASEDAKPVESTQTPETATPEFLKVNPVAPYAHPHDNSEQTKEES
ncbi:MAG: hypothetical protein U0491_01845 [Candidatus Saccharimonadales bacterium]